jgi:CxxC motif-containing protein
MTELICITCPRGCHLKVDEANDYAVTGNFCKRGIDYARNELINPKRVVTSTVRTNSAQTPRCPVKTNGAIPKGKMFDAVALLDGIELAAPIKLGDVVVANLFDTGVDFVACKDID